jgi:uncharacterized membrane protein YfcA
VYKSKTSVHVFQAAQGLDEHPFIKSLLLRPAMSRYPSNRWSLQIGSEVCLAGGSVTFFDFFNPLFALSGLVVGFIVGLTGVGGGSLMTPLLVLMFGVHPATAVGTDLMYAGLTKGVGTAVHGHNGTVSWRIVGLLACGSVPMAVATLLVLRWLGPGTHTASLLISHLLGVALLVTASTLVFRKFLMRRRARDILPRRQAVLTVASGAAIGILVSISSVGAGAIGIAALYFLYPHLPAKTIVGSDLAHAVPLTLVAGTGYWMLGSVDWMMLVSLLVGSVPGIILGSIVAPRIPDGVLRPILAAVLVIVGIRLLLR